MQLLTVPKTEYLLDVPLESLHTESIAWLKELAFWADEMIFFYTLLHHDKLSGSFPSYEVAYIDKELIKFKGEILDEVMTGIESHERLLASAFKYSSAVNEQVYRETHAKLTGDMHDLHDKMQALKRKVFLIVEDSTRNKHK